MSLLRKLSGSPDALLINSAALPDELHPTNHFFSGFPNDVSYIYKLKLEDQSIHLSTLDIDLNVHKCKMIVSSSYCAVNKILLSNL